MGKRPLPHLSAPRVIGSTARTLYAPDGCHVTSSFVEIHVPASVRVPLCFSLNSTLFQLMLNVIGRSGQGGGALVVANCELEDSLCVNPHLLTDDGSVNLDESILESEEWDVLEPSPARLSIDTIVFDILQLTQGERDGVYEAVTQLVTNRLQKAKT